MYKGINVDCDLTVKFLFIIPNILLAFLLPQNILFSHPSGVCCRRLQRWCTLLAGFKFSAIVLHQAAHTTANELVMRTRSRGQFIANEVADVSGNPWLISVAHCEPTAAPRQYLLQLYGGRHDADVAGSFRLL